MKKLSVWSFQFSGAGRSGGRGAGRFTCGRGDEEDWKIKFWWSDFESSGVDWMKGKWGTVTYDSKPNFVY